MIKSNLENKTKLTQRQFEVLQYVVTFVMAHHYQPDLKAIGAVFAVSPQSIYDCLNSIERKNWIRRQPGQSRSIELSPDAIGLVEGQLTKTDWVKP